MLVLLLFYTFSIEITVIGKIHKMNIWNSVSIEVCMMLNYFSKVSELYPTQVRFMHLHLEKLLMQ